MAENQPVNKHRMNPELSSFATRLHKRIPSQVAAEVTRLKQSEPPYVGCHGNEFAQLALEIFALQFKHNPAYRTICEARQLTPQTVSHWTRIPFVPTSIFKDLELSSIPPDGRIAAFHSSGTTEQKPSRHFHCAESLAVYEASLWQWFEPQFGVENKFIFLTPNKSAAPHSSLVHMFETVRNNISIRGSSANRAEFFGNVGDDGVWTIDFDAVIRMLKSACNNDQPLTILGTAFSFVHLLDFLVRRKAPV